MTNRTPYKPSDYEGSLNLKRVEKNSIINQLKKDKGIVKNSHKVLCPHNLPYGYGAFMRILHVHGIVAKDYGVVK